MTLGLSVVGTGTDVGKTLIAGALCAVLANKGYNVGYFKPVLSGALMEDGRLVPGDTSFVSQVAGLKTPWEECTPCIYQEALSPHLAARRAGRPVDIPAIMKSFHDLASSRDFLVVEAAGGLGVPLDDHGFLMVHLLVQFGFPGLLVAPAGLGGINQSVVSAAYSEAQGLSLGGIMLNRGEGGFLEEDNLAQIGFLTELPVYGPFKELASLDSHSLQKELVRVLPRPEELFGKSGF